MLDKSVDVLECLYLHYTTIHYTMFYYMYTLSLFSLLFITMDEVVSEENYTFPPDFLFGAASASYQVEGGWNESGKGENIWDRLVHTHLDWIADKRSGDVAADSYHLYKQDVQALKDMGMNFYRFSISWSRILPSGGSEHVNEDGINYYNNLINELLANNITPVVTMYHWDLPQPLQDLGGWLNEILVDYFEDYARVLFENFGDRVKWWITLNEPSEVCRGYSEERAYAPAINLPGIGDYLAAHTQIKSHARVYRLYEREYKQQQKGAVGITIVTNWAEPETDSEDDKDASERSMQFQLGWFAHPIFSKTGHYPPIMRYTIDQNSLKEKRRRSRLPVFSEKWLKEIKGSFDFFGLNHYTTRLVTPGEVGSSPSKTHDTGVISKTDPKWPGSASPWLKDVPWGLRKALDWVRKEYDNPPVLITENGFSDHGELEDTGRVNYLTGYLKELLKAIHIDGCNVLGYTVWSVIDNFEWMSGYTEKFGVNYVDFDDPSRPRKPKKSSTVLAEIIRTRKVPTKSGNV